MGLRFAAAKATGAALTWGLQNIMRRDGATMPGKYALKVDPDLIGGLAPRLREGSVLVVGTNGKTSVTNLLADVLEAAGKSVCCNRTGANLSWGVASSLMQIKSADWGVFETDELWIARVLPYLKSRYVVLLNLFPDQLDRFGEIDRVQESLVATLASSPETVLIYNADDPLCAAIAKAAPNRSVAFGVSGVMDAEGAGAGEAHMCQQCGSVLEYEYRQYSQLGAYACPTCGFARPKIDWLARNVMIGALEMTFEVEKVSAAGAEGVEGVPGAAGVAGAAGVGEGEAAEGAEGAAGAPGAGAGAAGAAGAAGVGEGVEGAAAYQTVRSQQSTPYLAYNLLAVCAASAMIGVSPDVVQRAIDAFNPKNGRLQRFSVQGHPVLLNLAKNPTGFNQNIRIIKRDAGPKVAAFFVNDMEGDGRDASWIWDVDFESIAADCGLRVFVGGMRANDLQVRLKYAGLSAEVVENMSEVFAAIAADGALADAASVYAIANYTALPPIRAELGKLEGTAAGVADGAAGADADAKPAADERAGVKAPGVDAGDAAGADEGAYLLHPVILLQLFPELLNAQGCGGNVRALAQRLAWRGIPVEVRELSIDEVQGSANLDLSQADLVFIGAGLDRELKLAAAGLEILADQMTAFENAGGVVLDVREGYVVRGGQCASAAAGAAADAAAGANDFAGKLAVQCQGPLLAFSPQAADALLEAILARYAERADSVAPQLAPLDDAAELAACAFMSAQRA